MSDLEVFGEVVTGPDVEKAILSILRQFAPTYLRWMERHTDRAANALPNIVSWRAADTIDERFPEQMIPACQVMVGDDVDIRTRGTSVSAIFSGSIDVLVQSTEPERARELAGLYGYALGTLLLQKPQLDESVPTVGLGWEKLGVPAIGKNGASRWLALGSIQVSVAVEGVATPLAGPAEPIEEEPPAVSVVESTRLEEQTETAD